MTDRKRLAGGGPVLYVCDYQGIPPPTVRWYYNGAAIPPASGVSVNGNTVMISDPQISHSGIYQCLARNTHAGENREDSRAWILEVRLPSELSGHNLEHCNDSSDASCRYSCTHGEATYI